VTRFAYRCTARLGAGGQLGEYAVAVIALAACDPDGLVRYAVVSIAEAASALPTALVSP
jgi:hypothetical protein